MIKAVQGAHISAVFQILVEEYLVFKAQWQRTSGHKYGWRPNVRSVVRPGAKVGAEGRVAVV